MPKSGTHLALVFVASLGMLPAFGAAQTVGVVTDRSDAVTETTEWAGVIYARAAAAVHAGNLPGVWESISTHSMELCSPTIPSTKLFLRES